MRVTLTNKQARRIDRAWLIGLAKTAMAAEGCPADIELSVAIGDDAWIKELNRRYRKKEAATDVLAFSQEGLPAAAGTLLGDVAISAETAARQAKERGHGLKEEMGILLIHGILHLTGWRDDTSAERRRMMRRTKEVLTQAAVSLQS